MRQREDGVCYAYSKADGNAYALPRSEFARLRAEWMAGRAFFEGQGFYGGALILRLGDVVAISDATTESLTVMREDRIADLREDALEA